MIKIVGVIGQDVKAADVAAALAKSNDRIVIITSPGGDVEEGLKVAEIMAANKCTTIARGLCASIATVIFASGSMRYVAKDTEFFIHNPYFSASYLEGDAEFLQKICDKLLEYSEIISYIYAENSTLSQSMWQKMMRDETTLTLGLLVGVGLCHKIIRAKEDDLRDVLK